MTTAKINDVPLVGVSEIRAMKVSGLQPDTFEIPFLIQDLKLLTDNGPTFGLPGGANTVTFTIGSRVINDLRLLYVSKGGAGARTAPFAVLHLADRRHYWQRKILSAAYNIKRRSGLTKAQTNTVERVPEGSLEVLDQYTYRSGTLINGRIATIREAFIEQMGRLGEVNGTSYFLTADFGQSVLASMEFTGPGDEMIAKILEQTPDYTLYMLDSGQIDVVKKSNVSEATLYLESIQPKLEEGTGLANVDMSGERPIGVHVYYDVEGELLFRHLEDKDEFDISTGKKTLADYLDYNVNGILIPALEGCCTNPTRNLVSLDGAFFDEGAKVKLSTYMRALSLLRQPIHSAELGPPTYSVWRRIYLRSWESKAAYLLTDNKLDELWMRLIGAIDNSFRREFRVVKPWWDLFRAVLPTRSALVNPFDLTRAKAPIFTDYLLWPSHRLIFQQNISRNILFGFAVRSNHTDSVQRIAAPGHMSLEDPDAGVFRMNLTLESHGEYSRIAPGAITGLTSVTDVGQAETQIAQLGQELESGYGFSTIMTAMPYYKKSKTHLHRVEIGPKDCAVKLGQPIGECKGPVIEIKIPYSEVTAARFIWNDGNVQGCVDPFLKEDVEFNEFNLANRGMLYDIALASASMIYANMLDYTEGQLTTTADLVDPKLVGNVQAMQTSVDTKGKILTTFLAKGEFPIKSASGLMSDETKAALMRLKLI